MHLTDALILFKRLGVDAPSLSAREFSLAYLQLARRYHPDKGNAKSHELMANINAARTTILKAYDGCRPLVNWNSTAGIKNISGGIAPGHNTGVKEP